VAELRRRFQLSVGEVGSLDLHRRAGIGVAVVSADAAHAGRMLDEVERLVDERPEVQVLSTHRALRTSDD
jgi:uncharacterized protein YlxP (DUF503 family)